jgi:WD40 repeat protein
MLSTKSLTLAEGVMQTMFWNKMKSGALILLASLVLASFGGLALHVLAGETRSTATVGPKAVPPTERLEMVRAPTPQPPKAEAVKGLQLTLSTSMTETVMQADGSNAKPTLLKLTFANVGDTSIKLDAYDWLWRSFHLEVTGPDAKSVRIERLIIDRHVAAPDAEDFPEVKPGKSWSTDKHPFPGDVGGVSITLLKPGAYRVKAVYSTNDNSVIKADFAKGRWTGSVTSNEIILKVLPAEKEADLKPLYSPLVYAPTPKDDSTSGWNWKVKTVCDGHESIVMAVAFSPDGKLAVSGSDDQTLRFWNTTDGDQIRKVAMEPFIGGVRLSPNGNTLATTAHESVRFWDPKTGKETEKRWTVKQTGYGLAWSPDGAKLAVSADPGVQVWDVRLGQKLSTFQFEKESVAQTWRVAFSPDGAYLAVVLHSLDGDDGIPPVPLVRVLDVKTGKAVFTAWPSGHVNAVAFSPDGKTLFAAGMVPEGADNDGMIQAWDWADNKLLYKVRGDKHGFFCLAVSSNGKIVATGGTESAIKLWDAATGELKSKLEKHTDQIHDLAFSADGKTLASAGRDKLVIIWKLEK